MLLFPPLTSSLFIFFFLFSGQRGFCFHDSSVHLGKSQSLAVLPRKFVQFWMFVLFWICSQMLRVSESVEEHSLGKSPLKREGNFLLSFSQKKRKDTSGFIFSLCSSGTPQAGPTGLKGRKTFYLLLFWFLFVFNHLHDMILISGFYWKVDPSFS